MSKDEPKGQVMSFWISTELKEHLDNFKASYADASRSHYICAAIVEFLSEPNRRYLVEKASKPEYFTPVETEDE